MEIKPQHSSNTYKNERISAGSFIFWVVSFIGLIIIDQATKQAVFGHPQERFLFFKEVLLRNDRFAFSLPVPFVVMYSIYALLLAGIMWYLWRNYKQMSRVQIFGWICILAGAFSNIGERIITGSVRDFIYVLSGVFNLADAWILLGIVLLLLVDPPRP